MAANKMNMVDAIGDFVPRLARNRSAVLRFGHVAAVPAGGLVSVQIGTASAHPYPYLRGALPLTVGLWVALINDGDKWLVLDAVTEVTAEEVVT